MATIEFTTEELASEEWRPVVGWEGRYEVSNLGRLKSLRDFRERTRELILRQYTVGAYQGLTLGAGRTRLTHHLVAEAFLGSRVAGVEINHIDGTKPNNRASNLEYVTQAENMAHAARLGLTALGKRNGAHTCPERIARGKRHGSQTHPEALLRGAVHPNAKLSESAVLEMKMRLAAGDTQTSVSIAYNVSLSTVWLIAHGKRWTHLTSPTLRSVGLNRS